MTHAEFLRYLSLERFEFFDMSKSFYFARVQLFAHKQWVDEKYLDDRMMSRVCEVAMGCDNLVLLKFITEECGSQWFGSDQYIVDGNKTRIEKPLTLITYSLIKKKKDPSDLSNNPMLEYVIQTLYVDVDHKKILEELQKCEITKRQALMVQIDLDVAAQRQRQKLLSEIEDNNNDEGRGTRRM